MLRIVAAMALRNDRKVDDNQGALEETRRHVAIPKKPLDGRRAGNVGARIVTIRIFHLAANESR